MPTDKRAQSIISRFNRAVAMRKNWDNLYQEVADYVLPTRQFSGTHSPGERRDKRIYDDTAVDANDTLASALHGLGTNPASKWFTLRAMDRQIDAVPEVRFWLQDTTNRMFDRIGSSDFGFDTNAYEMYTDLAAFGQAFASIEVKRGKPMLVARPLTEMYGVDDFGDGRITTVFRQFTMTPVQAVQTFGADMVPAETLRRARDPGKSDQRFTYIQEVAPRLDRIPDRADALNKPFSSVVVDKESGTIVKESGFDYFPFLTPRWSKAPGELYGRGPGVKMASTIRMVNEMARVIIAQGELAIAPPLIVPANSVEGPIHTVANSIIYTRAGMPADSIQPLNTGSNPLFGMEFLEAFRNQIREGYLLNIVGPLPELDRQTGIEVMARLQQRSQTLSPIVSRIESEFLQPFVKTLFKIMLDAENFLPPPPQLLEVGMEIEFISPLAASQRAGDINSLIQHFQIIAPFVQGDPSIFGNYNVDGVFRTTANLLNVPQEMVRDPQEVAAIRQQAAQQQQQTEAVQQAAIGADAAQKGARAIKDLNASAA